MEMFQGELQEPQNQEEQPLQHQQQQQQLQQLQQHSVAQKIIDDMGRWMRDGSDEEK